jgi:hypothetical protein
MVGPVLAEAARGGEALAEAGGEEAGQTEHRARLGLVRRYGLERSLNCRIP